MAVRRDWFWLSGIWVIITAYNLYKPFHIDDTAHLIISAWILQHPLHPMRGPLNWSGTVQPIYDTNQPHLYFYALAGWEKLFGFSEVALHSLQSLFAAACIGIFYATARRLAGAHAVWLTAMLALNPAFIVEQNLMVDVPLLSCWLGFFASILCAIDSPRQTRRFVLAGLACSAAILIKYSSLVLMPMLFLVLVLERRWRQAWCLAIPVAALIAWSAFNIYDYGGVHLATAFHASAAGYAPPRNPSGYFSFLYKIPGLHLLRKVVKSGFSWDIGIGALTCFGAVLAASRLPRFGNVIYLFCFGGLISLALLVVATLLSGHVADKILSLVFLLNGGLVVLAVVKPRRDLVLVYLQAWIILTSLFYIFASPFIAARHLLLIIPAISLLIASEIELPRNAKVFGLAMTSLLSVGLCLSDFRFAEFYKSEASTVRSSLPAGATIWAAGHWGWQYYAMKNGFPEIDVGSGLAKAIANCQFPAAVRPGTVEFLEQDSAARLPKDCSGLDHRFPNASPIKPGDYILVPLEVDYELPTNIRIKFIRKDNDDISSDDPFCTVAPDGLYSFAGLKGPWSLSSDCNETVEIVQVIQ